MILTLDLPWEKLLFLHQFYLNTAEVWSVSTQEGHADLLIQSVLLAN